MDQIVCSFPNPVDSNRSIFMMPDTSHLLKNIRSSFITSYDSGVRLPQWLVDEEGLESDRAKIDHIRMLLELNKREKLRLCPFLDEDSLSERHFLKMKTSLAKRLFSLDVAAAIRTLVQMKQMPREALATAVFVEKICKWGDIMMAKLPQRGLLPASDHASGNREYLKESIKFFTELKFGFSGEFLPSQSGCQIASSSVLGLEKELFSLGYKFVLPGNFMGDAIENLFSQVRHKNPVPTMTEFSNNLRSITLSQYLAVKKTTSYDVDHDSFFSLSKNSENVGEQDVEPMNYVSNQEIAKEEIDSDDE